MRCAKEEEAEQESGKEKERKAKEGKGKLKQVKGKDEKICCRRVKCDNQISRQTWVSSKLGPILKRSGASCDVSFPDNELATLVL